ncbi:TerB family tellurite resistance protein [uncultured Cohaesibacter sp.]|uniref:tellurite resistance TerB family protein n=1 Tax=uncultured Cohaesibacter sp. TaxID=1002546 RepID=UPI0029C97036|nr:TerB family tellurite resistance protein [uncultured Cohaesibacter sp.]
MFDKLMEMFRDLAGETVDDQLFSAGDHRVATAALLVHLVAVDGVIDEQEQATLKTVLMEKFDLSEDETADLIAVASQQDKEAVDFYHFTSILKRELDEQGRIEMIEMMWELVFADGQIDEFEDNMVWRVSELLGVSRRDRIRMRQHVQAQAELSEE